MDLLIIVPVHADERGAGKSIIPGEECATHTNDTVKPGYSPGRWKRGRPLLFGFFSKHLLALQIIRLLLRKLPC